VGVCCQGLVNDRSQLTAPAFLGGVPLSIPADTLSSLGTGNFTVSGHGFEFRKMVPATPVICSVSTTLFVGAGLHLTLKTSTGVTSCQSNLRHLQFGIDDDRGGRWESCGRPGDSILAFSLAVHDNELYAGTCEPAAGKSGRVYRYAGESRWIDCGAPDQSNSVTCMAVWRGHLYVGTGKYRLGGSSLTESPNTELGGEFSDTKVALSGNCAGSCPTPRLWVGWWSFGTDFMPVHSTSQRDFFGWSLRVHSGLLCRFPSPLTLRDS
jgi:hypothetical protein